MTKREKQIIAAQINIDAGHYQAESRKGNHERADFFLTRLNRLLYVAGCLGVELVSVDTETGFYYKVVE